MNLDSLSFALSYISHSVANLTKKNYKSTVQELSYLVVQHGLEAERHLLRCLFSHVDFSGDGKSSGKDFHQTQYLIQECVSLITKSNFISNLCYAVDNPLHHQKSLKPSAQLFPQLSKVLKLTRVQEVAFGLALLQSSNQDTKSFALQFVKQKLPDLLRSYIDSDTSGNQEGGLHDTAPEFLHLILSSLFPGSKEQFGIGTKQKDAFLSTLRKDFPRERVPVVLAPLLYSDTEDLPTEKLALDCINTCKTMVEGSLPDLILELGYNFCTSVEECHRNLLQLGVREMNPATLARVVAVMSRTYAGLNEQVPLQNLQLSGSLWNDKDKTDNNQATTWNVDVFIQALQDTVGALNWKEVILELDHHGFIIKDRQGLHVLTQALLKGLNHETFPIELYYRHWKNTEGQLSLFHHVLKNSDVFCFADYIYHAVAVDILKAPPEDDNRDIATWKSLDLIDTLLYLSEGHYTQVQELFKFPVQHCPDMLVLGLLQINPSNNILRQELLTNLMPIFLGNHPNSAIVLNYAWHVQAQTNQIKTIIMQAMADWYMRGENDQSRLSRILDVAQDLKALSSLLNAPQFPFVIDLACLASRREYLKLDKWLSDKIREHGEPFIVDCVNFLKRRVPQVMGSIGKDDTLPKSGQLPTETLANMLVCLQAFANNVSQDISDTIHTMANNCTILLNKSRQPPPNIVKATRSLEPPFSSGLNNSLLTSQLDPLSNLGAGIAGLSLAGSVGTHSNSIFPVSGGLGSFTTPGSPAKIFPNTSNVAQGSFSNMLAPLPTQMPSQIGTQLGLNTSSMIGNLGNIGSKTSFNPPPSVNPRQTNTPDISSVFTDSTQQVSSEVEDEANSYFQRIYNHPPHPTLSIDEVLEMLKKFQDSPAKRERDVFNCMLRNLFEEYRFFPQYPEKELQTTAQLFGGIIEQGLVTYLALGYALRFVLEALRKPYASKMYCFGIAALDRFKSRQVLKDYPQYCQHLTSIPHFQDFPPHLIEYVKYGANSQEPPDKPQGSVLPASIASAVAVSTAGKTVTAATSAMTTSTTIAKNTSLSGKPSIANATNIDTLLGATEKDEQIAVPPESTQDKIAFIFNNLSQVNLVQKTEELKEVVTEEHWSWISQYLVMKRVSIEHNFHTLYSTFLDTLKISEFTKMVIKETFRNIKVLLRSDKVMANFSDRSLLKNLGHWLGMLTLAKNKPILQIDIDIKALLVEAYHKGQQELLYVVPFVAKVLDSCAKSKVFKPPNPWTMGIMNVLAELHQESNLKLNLKFEIEVLCKALNLDINDLKPGVLLKDLDRLARIEHQLSQPQKKIEQLPIDEPIQSGSSSVTVSTPTSSLATTMTAATTTTTTTVPILAGPPDPRFSYGDINIANLQGLAPHIIINNQINLFQSHPQFKTYVRSAIERAVQEWIHPVVDRSIKIALTTCEQIVKKDFAVDPDEGRMRAAAFNMVRNLTAGMALITCRDHLLISINANLKAAFLSAMRGATQQQKEIVEQASTIVAQDNVELACAFIQKTAIEKAIPEMDKRLNTEFELRKHARNEGRRYCDPVMLTYQAERMPEQIRLKVGGTSNQQMAVYEEFARNLPGFLPSHERETSSFLAKPIPSYAADDLTQTYDKIIVELESYIQATLAPMSNPQVVALHNLLESVIIARNARDVITASAVVQKDIEAFLEGMAQLPNDPDLAVKFRDGHLLVLKGLQDPRAFGPLWTNKQVTKCLIECREDYKYNLEAVDCLIRSHLINMQQYDYHLAQSMENGLNYMAVGFAIQLVRNYLIDERHVSNVTDSDLYKTIEILVRIALHSRQPPDGLTQLIEFIRTNADSTFIERGPTGPTSMMHSGISQAREYDDPPGLHEKTEYLLREWVNMYHSPTAGKDSTKAFSIFVHQVGMNLHGILKTDDLITRFFRLSTELCVELCYRTLSEQPSSPTIVRAKCFHTLDAFVRLIALLVKHSGDSTNTVTKINLLNKVLGIVTGVLLQDQEGRQTEFQQLPYHRIFIMLLLELNAPEHVLETINFQVLTAFCNTFHILRPAKAPGFAYSWLELVSHRVFIGRMLALTPQQKGWGMYAQLLIDLFKFLAPFLRNAELAKPVALLYKGTLRLLLVLLHDFPEFLCDYHYGFCDAIPTNCIQMRNLILSAFPRNMRLPDPFTPNLKVDMLPEITCAPRVLPNFASMIQPPNFKKDLDSYIKTRAPVTFLSELRSNLQLINEPGMHYNIPLINALVLYVGTQAIGYINSKGLTPSMSTITHSSHMDIFQNLAVDLDTEGRYLFLNAIANQLRYPNSHTHYFSCTLLYLFAEANTEAIQEQITRQSFVREADCQPTTPVGSSDNVY
uniref:CCR4-NOT transcription complex subunit 1 n=1 Tax=Strigamia maritima TaxID=126957 RepID=T1ISW7_STRMM